MIFDLALSFFRFRDFFTFPHDPCCEAKTPATLTSRVCLSPVSGSSRVLQRECISCLFILSRFSAVNCFGSWYKCKYNLCRRSLIEPDFFRPNTPKISPSCLFFIDLILSFDKSHSDKTRFFISLALTTSTGPFFGKSLTDAISFKRSNLAWYNSQRRSTLSIILPPCSICVQSSICGFAIMSKFSFGF